MLSIEIAVRKAVKEDVPRIKELWDSLVAYHKQHCGYGHGIFEYRKDKDARYLRFLKKQIRRRNAAVFVAEVDGKIVGHVMVETQNKPPIYVNDKQAYVCEIVVDKRYRGRGIGKALMEKAEWWAKKKGMYSIGLVVHVKNKAAYSVYTKSGFREHHLKMAKKIK